MITTELKQKVLDAIKARKSNYPSDSKFASLLNVQLTNSGSIVAAETPVFKYITTQLSECQDKSISFILCDLAGIGKTFAAQHYVREHKNSVYIDCSQVKTKQKLVRQIAKEFGLTHTGRYHEVYDDLIFYLRSIPNPLVVLDEAGDLDYAAFLELKALWNATEHVCGWYMMGADGLKAKIESNMGRKKVGYAELFRRYGEKYQKVTPDGKVEMDKFSRLQVAMVAKANGIDDVQGLYAKTGGSLSRLYIEIQKLKNLAA